MKKGKRRMRKRGENVTRKETKKKRKKKRKKRNDY